MNIVNNFTILVLFNGEFLLNSCLMNAVHGFESEEVLNGRDRSREVKGVETMSSSPSGLTKLYLHSPKKSHIIR